MLLTDAHVSQALQSQISFHLAHCGSSGISFGQTTFQYMTEVQFLIMCINGVHASF